MQAHSGTDIQEMRELLLEYMAEAMEGKRYFSDSVLTLTVSIALNEHLPAAIRDSILMLTRIVYTKLQYPMAVQLENNSLKLLIDLRYVDAIRRLGDASAGELCNLLHHELAHVLLGHVDGPLHEFADPVMILAKEIAVNDGWLALGDTICPLVRLSDFAFADEVYRYAQEHQYPKDWLQRYRLVYKALVAVGGNVAYGTRGELSSYLARWGVSGAPIQDYTDGQDDTQVLIVYDGSTVSLYPVTMLSPADPDQLHRIHESVRDELVSAGYQYDATSGEFHYSPQGYSADERLITYKSYRVPWHEIRKVFGIKRTLGYDRRRGHLYPPDEAPMVHHNIARKTVYVFYDSSGSVPDEVLSGFIGTMKRSPFRIKEHFFSTKVTLEPHTGGTDFECIERYLLKQERYPDIVVVLTDGLDSKVFSPKHPDRWHWVVYGDAETPRKIGGKVFLVEEVSSYV